jgi:hypothetical protein
MPVTVSSTDPNARAQNAAQLKYGGQEDAIKRAIQSLAVTRAADEAAINIYGTGGRGAINTTFDELAGNLGINREQTKKDLGTQANIVGQGYRDANSIAEAARQQAVANLQGLAGSNSAFQSADLGAAASPIEALAARIIGQNAMSDATTTGNLQTWAGQQDALLGAGMAGAERDRSNRLSGFESELLAALAAAKNNASKSEYDYNARLLDLINERGAFTADAAANFADTAFGQQLQAAQLNLQEQEAASSAASRAAQLALASDENNWKRGLAEREASKPDTSEYWKQLEYGLKKDALAQDSSRYLDQQNQQNLENQTRIAAMLFPDDPGAQEQFMAANGYDFRVNEKAKIAGILGQQVPGLLSGIRRDTRREINNPSSNEGWRKLFSGMLA